MLRYSLEVAIKPPPIISDDIFDLSSDENHREENGLAGQIEEFLWYPGNLYRNVYTSKNNNS